VISDRETFLAVSYTGPLLNSDAIVVLAGQDGTERAKAAVQLFRMEGAKTIVLSGGVDGEGKQSAETLQDVLWQNGVSPSAIILESESTNTREQAVNVVNLAMDKEWKRIILVASHYHSPRAFLTFVRALRDVEMDEEIRIVNFPVSHVPWFKKPEGSKYERSELLSGEMGKIALYKEHVATYCEGLDYLEYWEGR
jgi:uncharacterized SAM-binding protein YcdF (DUF218 family)